MKKYLAPIGLFLVAAFTILRYFMSPKAQSGKFPSSEAKKKAQADVAETKKEIDAVEEKSYSDKEIEDFLNK